MYVRDDIPFKELNTFNIGGDTECIFIELNFRKSKWLLLAAYKPPDISKISYFDNISKALDFNSDKYENIILMGDLNTLDTEEVFCDFLEEHFLTNLVKFPTCYKNAENPTSIDLIITNHKYSFQNTTSFSTGLSDFHKLVITSMKLTFPKSSPQIIKYRNMKNLNREDFRNELRSNLDKMQPKTYGTFENTFFKVLDKHAPEKTKFVRANHKPYVTKAMRVAIMKRSELATKFRKEPTETNKKAFRKQRNFCNRLYKRERKKYYEKLDLKNLTDSKRFWKTIKPFLSDKTKSSNKICLKEGERILTDDTEIANVLNKHFVDSVRSLAETGGCSQQVLDYNLLDDPIENIICRFKNHPSIIAINSKKFERAFEFQPIDTEKITEEIKKLDANKTATGISIAMLKDYVDIFAPILAEIFNDCISKGTFPDELKLADISPIFKSIDSTAKKNYRPISILKSVSKLFEKLIQNQLSPFFDENLSQYLCGYRKGYTTQYALLKMIESWKKVQDDDGHSAAVLMDLSKAFDTINHDLLVAKLYAYGIRGTSLKLLQNYLSNRYQRTKIEGKYSTWEELLTGVPQGSVLGPILFNIYLNDLFYIVEYSNICNFADDTTPNCSKKDLNEAITNVEHDCSLLVEWFRDNYMTLNVPKCHLLVSGFRNEAIFAKVGDALLWEENSAKLLGIIIDSSLAFDNHVKMLCKKASQKLTAISRMSKFMSQQKRKTLMRTFFESQFNYCPLIWMFCSRHSNHRINKLHERALRIAYNDYFSDFSDLLIKDNAVTIHQRNLRSLAIEMYKITNNLCPAFIKDLMTEISVPYNSRSTTQVTEDINGGVKYNEKSNYMIPETKTVSFGLESIRYLGPKIWMLVPDELKKSSTLELFKERVRKLKFEKCPCKLCKTYIKGLGYVN